MGKKFKVFLFETSVEGQHRTLGLVDEDNDQQPAMGLLYLDAILKKNGHEVITKDYITWGEENCLKSIQKIIEEFKPEVVGIGMMTFTRSSSYKAIKLVKKINPKIKIILGGIHPSMMYQQLLQNFPIDAICIGEADESLIEVLEAFSKQGSLAKIKGIAFKNNDLIVLTEKRPLLTDLEKLPYPSYDLFMKPSIKSVQILSSRGCPNKCSFCCLDITSRRVWRKRDFISVVNEIEYIKNKFPWVETIQFLDDTFTLDNQRVIDICKEIIKRKIKLNFFGQARIKPVSREMVYWMEKAGFNSIYFGIETGSEEILKSINKGITKAEIINTFKIFKDFKRIKVEKFIIVGFPGETKKTVHETIRFIRELQKIIKFNYHYAAPLWVYPGTDVYNLSVKKGSINDEYWLTDNPVPYFTLEHDEKWLLNMSTKITLSDVLAHGELYFIKKVLNKLISNPKHYLNRFIGKTKKRELRIIE